MKTRVLSEYLKDRENSNPTHTHLNRMKWRAIS